ncbi:MAG: D-2-hydroxyacid dehydrogenase [Bacillota bacterium]
MKILIDFDLDNSYVEKLKEINEDIEVVVTSKKEEIKKEIVDSDVLFDLRGVDLEDIKSANNLKWIQSWTAGVDKFMTGELRDYIADNQIILTNMSGVHSNIIAEHSLGFMINFSRRFCEFNELKKEKTWDELKVGQLENRTVTVVGFGSIGREIGKRAKAFHMNVIGVNRDGSGDYNFADEIYSQDNLLKALKKADYVVAIMPLTEETKGMFGKEEFSVMKKSAYFINMARGEVVDEEVMIEALKNEEIAGAGLDVFYKEPLPEDSELYELDNVLMTPHVGGVFPEYNKKAIKIARENLEKFFIGSKEKMINKVDYDLGY